MLVVCSLMESRGEKEKKKKERKKETSRKGIENNKNVKDERKE